MPLRPRPRPRYLPADDAAVLDANDPAGRAWLVDSKGLVCLLCGAREIRTAEGMRAHREGCKP